MESKVCTHCHNSLPMDSFHRESRNPDGKQRWCRECANQWRRDYYKDSEPLREKRRVSNRKWHAANKDGHNHSIRAMELRRRYGLSWEGYQRMLSVGKCGLCETTTPGGKGQWHIDHCHITGVVRGLLCHNCNTWLGVYEKFIEKVGEEKIKAYLKTVRLTLIDTVKSNYGGK